MNALTTRIAPLLAALLLAACSTAPELTQPEIDMPAAFKEPSQPLVAADGSSWKPAQPAEAQARGQWWLAFNDSALNALIFDATRANANLAVAAARVKQARAIAGITEADRSVQLGAGAGTQRSRVAGSSYQAGLTASYEIDLFGRLGAASSAAQADAQASEATYKSVLLALQADVAQTYFRLRETDAELDTLNRTVDLRTQSVMISQSRYDNGDIGEFDLARAKTELATAKAEAIGVQRQRAQQE
ncbi:MAG: TolC family protein, partial [Telluria sp.]